MFIHHENKFHSRKDYATSTFICCFSYSISIPLKRFLKAF